MSKLFTQGWYDRVEALLALIRGKVAAASAASLPALSSLIAIENHRVQRVGPLSAVGLSVHFDSAAFTLLPSVVAAGILPGSPTVKVTGSATVTGTPAHDVLFQLVRDRGTGSQVILAEQHGEIGATTPDIATITLAFLDTADAVDAITLAPAGLTEGSIHTYSIVATSDANITGDGSALVLLEQEPGGTSFTVGAAAGGVPLGGAGLFAGFASAGITNSGPSSIIGDIGTDSAQSLLTGFSLVPASDGGAYASATSSQVTGLAYAINMTAGGTPAKVIQANTDMLAAYTDASTRAPTHPNDFNGGGLGGQTLTPGVWRWTTGVTIAGGNLTLNGAGVYILQVAGTLDLEAARSVILAGGALPQNVFWAVAGASSTLHAGSSFQGQLLALFLIAVQAAASVRGRLLAQSGLTLLTSTIVEQ
jgi:hypothetical protein